MRVIVWPPWLCVSVTLAWSRWLVWVGMEVGGGAARGWAGCLEEALRCRRPGGDGRAVRAPLPEPR